MKKFDILEVVQVLWKKIWIITLAFIVCAVGGFSYSAFYATPIYQTQAAVLVTAGGIFNTMDGDNTTSKISNGEITTTRNMMETYAYSLRMMSFNEKVASKLAGKTSVPYSAKTVRGMTVVSFAESALLIRLQVSGTNPADIKIIAQAVADLANEHLGEVFPGTKAIVSEDATDYNMTYPNDTLFTLGGGMVGALIAAAIIYIIAVRDNTIKTEDDIAAFEIAVLGYVPDFNETKGGGYYGE